MVPSNIVEALGPQPVKNMGKGSLVPVQRLECSGAQCTFIY